MESLMRLFFYSLLGIVLFTGCAKQLNFADFEKGESFIGNANTLTKEIIVTLPTGETLSGEGTHVSNANFSFGAANAYSGTLQATTIGYNISSFGSNQGYAILKSHTSKLMMEIIVTYGIDGHGFGEARTNDGRKYKVSF